MKKKAIIFFVLVVFINVLTSIIATSTDTFIADTAIENVNGDNQEYLIIRGSNSLRNNLTIITPASILILFSALFWKEIKSYTKNK